MQAMLARRTRNDPAIGAAETVAAPWKRLRGL